MQSNIFKKIVLKAFERIILLNYLSLVKSNY